MTNLIDGLVDKPEIVFAIETPFTWTMDCDNLGQPGHDVIATATHNDYNYKITVESYKVSITNATEDEIKEAGYSLTMSEFKPVDAPAESGVEPEEMEEGGYDRDSGTG